MNNEENDNQIALPEIYFDHRSGNYWVRNNRGQWIRFSETSLKRLLKSKGLSAECSKMERLSQVDEAILQIQTTQDVNYAASLAGYTTGLYQLNGGRILVTDSPVIIQPAPGEFPILSAILDGMLNHGDFDQRPYLYGWLKIGYECLITAKKRPGQTLAMAGPVSSGKSLLQNLITQILGGRAAKPYRYMSGQTPFNSELFQAEHLMIEDEVASTDIRTRRHFGTNIKQVTVNVVQSCHPKGLPAISLEPLWRTTITLNDEPENLLILPPFDESIIDKIILMKVFKKLFPVEITSNEDRSRSY